MSDRPTPRPQVDNCPMCGEPWDTIEKHPNGWTECRWAHEWRVVPIRCWWVPFSDTQRRAHRRFDGWAIETRTHMVKTNAIGELEVLTQTNITRLED